MKRANKGIASGVLARLFKRVTDNENQIEELGTDLQKIHMEVINVTTESDSNCIELNIPNIYSSIPLFIQLQSNSTDVYVKQYFITKVGTIRIYLSDTLEAGIWMFNVMYYM